jgi:hypothetical protein
MRSPSGRISGTTAYADFLSVATKLIGTRLGGYGFIDQKVIPDVKTSESIERPALKYGKILPVSDGAQLFGVQVLTRLKLEPSNGSLKSIKDRWVKLRDKSKGERIAYLEKIDDDLVVWIRGDIPVHFFPSEIELLPSQKLSSPAPFQLYTELTNAVRGGVVTTKGGNVVLLRHLPFMNKLPFLGRYRYRPFVNDVLQLRTGQEYTITKVTFLDGFFFLELNHPITPYFVSNDDIVTIKPKYDDYFHNDILKVSSTTNSEYFFGRDRFLHIDVNISGRKLGKGDYIISDNGGNRYYVSSSNNDRVTIDLFESNIWQICSKINSKDSKYEDELVLSDRHIHSVFLNELGNCNIGSGKYTLAFQVLKRLNELDDPKSIFHNFFKDKEKSFLNISAEEVFSRSLDMHFFYSCNSCGESKSIEDSVPPLPMVYGNGAIWETYPGSMLNIYYGTLNPSVPELMIHALGKDISGKYYRRFEAVQPSFVALANPRQFTPWLYAWHWPFFEELLLNYKEYYSNSDFSLWYRPNNSWLKAESYWDGDIQLSNNKEFILPIRSDEELSVYTVSLKYDVKNPLKVLPLLGNAARFFVTIEGANTDIPVRPPISLPLNEKDFSFPVFVQGKAVPHLKVDLVDPVKSGASVILRSVSWRKVPVTSTEVANLLYYAPAFRTLMVNSKSLRHQ